MRDHNGQQVAYVYFEDEPGPRSSAKLLTRNEAQRIAANIATLPVRLIDAEVFVHVGCAHFDASAISCCQRLTTPAIAAPRMGASQNSQSCAI
jgi:hypothetical protein